MRGERTPDPPPTRRRKPRSRRSVSVGNSSTDGKFASLATSCESYSGTQGASLRAVKQQEEEDSADSESSSCSSKLAECHSERKPSLRAVKQEEAEASVDSESSSCSSKLAECHSERRPSLRAVKQEAAEAFDICVDESKHVVTLRPSLFALNREKRRNCKQKKYLRPGMVLLKGFIEHRDQVRIIKECRELGIGAGGFYTPGYSDGAKLRLQMMCLGKNWDPETSSYEEKRFFDGAVPPKIPQLFEKLVENAIQASHCFLRQEDGVFNVEEELPCMSPDICIVNFYSNSGKLGLHQDKDESKSSLVKGLPVVSFSLGDSAEFLYGVERDVDKAEKVELESGDVLLFGGKSRHIFHGVPCIKPKTAPALLTADSKLRPGRLNLTFRQY